MIKWSSIRILEDLLFNLLELHRPSQKHQVLRVTSLSFIKWESNTNQMVSSALQEGVHTTPIHVPIMYCLIKGFIHNKATSNQVCSNVQSLLLYINKEWSIQVNLILWELSARSHSYRWEQRIEIFSVMKELLFDLLRVEWETAMQENIFCLPVSY